MYSAKEIDAARALHKEKTEHRFELIELSLREKTSPEIGRDIAVALRELHAMLTEGGVVEWFANLYDGEAGGFYYSNSARDVRGFLPDLESTRQALAYFESCGMAAEFQGDMVAALPAWLGGDIIRFVKKMQDKNGYFYHPQWSREDSDAHLARLGRDLEWAVWLLSKFGAKPTYDTPNGVKGDGLLADGRRAPDFSCSECDGVGGASEELVKAHLVDKDSFTAYLNEFDASGEIYTNSWKVGNLLESQASMIYGRDEVLRSRGADYSLCDILAEWLERHQNPKNGAWTLGDTVDTGSTNGILKIASAYNKIKREFPRPLLAIDTAITIAKSREPIPSVCHALNPWYAMSVLMTNVKEHSNSEEGEAVMAEVSRLGDRIIENAADMIRAAVEKLSVLKMEDGSFEFAANGKNGYAQGMPIAVQDLHEGNVNAYICTRAVAAHIYNVLGYENMPLFGEGDRMEFVNILEEKHKNAN